jgi:hypothetical protein
MIDKISDTLEKLYNLDINKKNSTSVSEKFNFTYDTIPVEIHLRSLPNQTGRPERGFQGYTINFLNPTPDATNNLLFSIDLLYRKVHPIVGKDDQVFTPKDKEAILASIDLEKFNQFLVTEVDSLAKKANQTIPKTETAQDIASNILKLRSKTSPDFDKIVLNY